MLSMAGRIPESFVQDLLARVNLVELIDSRVPLKKTGRNYSACCPFHQENTPSFTVAPDKQFYYCFGCGASGNAVGFLMEYEHLSFPEAVKQLADRSGLTIPETRPETDAEKHKKSQLQQIYDLLDRAQQFYIQQLRHAPEKEKAVKYLKNRGLSGAVAKQYGLGFAPPGFDNLLHGLSLDSHNTALAVTAGLLVQREDNGRIYDKFRDRIIFPIRDSRGRPIGFGGRVLGDDKPKYLNSPETPVFHKGRELYGLWEWKQSRDRSDRLYVVEGYMDVIALAQHGVPNAVATLGTATSEDHARLLFKHVNEVILCFDGDKAGVAAAWRALESLLPCLDDGKQVRFLFLPDGEDPDTLVRQQGPEALRAMTDKASTLAEYLFSHLSEGLNLETVDGRARLARLAMPYLDKPAGPVYRLLLEEELARITRLERDALSRLRANATDSSSNSTPPAPTPRAATPEPPPAFDYDDMPPLDAEEDGWRHGLDDFSPAGGAPAPRKSSAPRRRGQPLSLAEQLILVLFEHPDLVKQHPLPDGVELLSLPHLDLLIQVAGLCQHHHTPPSLMGAVMALEQGDTLHRLMRASLKPVMDATTATRLWNDALSQLNVARLETEIELQYSHNIPDPAYLQKLLQQLSEARMHAREPLPNS